MLNMLSTKYVLSNFKKRPWSLIKEVLILVPVLAILGLFMTALIVPYIDESEFLRNSGHDFIVESANEIKSQNTFYTLKECKIGDVKKVDENYWFRSSDYIDLYMMGENVKNLEDTYFTEKNVLAGNIKDLENQDEIGIAISIQTALKLKLGIGDKLMIDLTNFIEKQVGEEENGIYNEHIMVPAKIRVILGTKYLKISEAYGGIGLIKLSSKFEEMLQDERITYGYRAFLKSNNEVEKNKNYSYIYRKDEIKAASIWTRSTHELLIVGGIIPFMGFILIYFIVNSELKFFINRRIRDCSILMALGTSLKNITNIFMLDQIIKIFIASLFAGMCYKYILFEKYQCDYINMPTLISVIVVYNIIGIFVVMVKLRSFRLYLRKKSIIEILSVKEM